jgi:tetratricopeptide (TPR) repeat protein
MTNRIKKYNPAFLSPEELVHSFVVRHNELELIVRVIRENVAESNQHVLVIGPRGIGKTMLVLRVVEEIRKEKALWGCWYPLVFSEESYPVITPGEFWLEALFHLAHQTKEEQWMRTYEELRDERDEERLRERALAQLMDFADAEGKRILLVVENFNMLLGDQINDSDAWKLRHTLLHEKRVMLLATATSRFEEIDNADKAMFELFKLHELGPLDEKECGILWSSISMKEASDERVRPLQILTGGNPRLLAIISNFAARMSLKELMDGLMQLVDDHTEYFKVHLDNLPPILRKVYLALAELWDPVPARNVAKAARLGVSKASALLRRLIERGMVLELNGNGRKKLYQVSERMYNIYYLMRRRGAPSRRVKALVRFMVPFYGSEELVSLTQRVAEEACKLDPKARMDHFWLYEGILESTSEQSLRESLIKVVPPDFFKMPDMPDSVKSVANKEVLRMLERAKILAEGGDQLEEVERIYLQILDISPENWEAWVSRGKVLQDLGRYEEAEQAYRKVIELLPESSFGWGMLGYLFHECLENYEEARKAYLKALELDSKDSYINVQLGRLLYKHFEDFEGAEKIFRQVIKLEDDYVLAWMNLGTVLHKHLSRYKEAEEAYRKAIKLKPRWSFLRRNLADLLKDHSERYEEAEQLYRKALEIEPDSAWGWFQLGVLLGDNLERYEEAERAYYKALEIDEKFAWAWAQLGQLLHEKLERYEEAKEAYLKVIEIDESPAWGWAQLGLLLHEKLERYEEAEKAYRKAIKIDEKYAWTYARLGLLLHEKLEHYEEAEQVYRKALELEPDDFVVLINLFSLLLDKMGQTKAAVSLAEEFLEKHPENKIVLNNCAWALHKHEGRDVLYKAEDWARRAIDLEPSNGWLLHTLASILCISGNGSEALEGAREYLKDTKVVKETINDAIDLFIGLAAGGYEREALKILVESPSAEILEPLVVGLRLFVGEDVKAAAEIMEVGRDVVKRIEQRKKEMRKKKKAGSKKKRQSK